MIYNEFQFENVWRPPRIGKSSSKLRVIQENEPKNRLTAAKNNVPYIMLHLVLSGIL